MAEEVRNGRRAPAQSDGFAHEVVSGKGYNADREVGRPHVRARTLERAALVEVSEVEYLVGDAARAVIDDLSRQVRDYRHTRLVVGLTGVRHASGDALATLARLARRVMRRGGWVRLWGVDPTIRDLLQLTGMDTDLDVCEGRSEALGLLDR